MMHELKQAAKALLPPVLKTLYRKFVPIPPMYRGVFTCPEAIADQRPWISPPRLAEVETTLADVISGAAARPLGSEYLIPTLIINACTDGACRVLDFGGGAGVAYFQCRPFLSRLGDVDWTVVDSGQLIAIGRRHASAQDRVRFLEALPQDETFDIVYVNTVFQYIPKYKEVLAALVRYRPRWLILTRLVAGDIPGFFTQQCNIPGGTTYSMFLNQPELVSFCAQLGYKPVHSSLAPEDTWESYLYRDVPIGRQLRYTVNIVLQAD